MSSRLLQWHDYRPQDTLRPSFSLRLFFPFIHSLRAVDFYLFIFFECPILSVLQTNVRGQSNKSLLIVFMWVSLWEPKIKKRTSSSFTLPARAHTTSFSGITRQHQSISCLMSSDERTKIGANCLIDANSAFLPFTNFPFLQTTKQTNNFCNFCMWNTCHNFFFSVHVSFPLFPQFCQCCKLLK